MYLITYSLENFYLHTIYFEHILDPFLAPDLGDQSTFWQDHVASCVVHWMLTQKSQATPSLPMFSSPSLSGFLHYILLYLHHLFLSTTCMFWLGVHQTRVTYCRVLSWLHTYPVLADLGLVCRAHGKLFLVYSCLFLQLLPQEIRAWPSQTSTFLSFLKTNANLFLKKLNTSS